jgi:transposase
VVRPRTETLRAAVSIAYFERPHTSNGPAEAIDSNIENLRGNAIGFRNLATYTARALIDTSGLRHRIQPLVQ